MNLLQPILFSLCSWFMFWAEEDRMHFDKSLKGNYETGKDKTGSGRGGQNGKEKLRGINNSKYFPKKSYGYLLL